MMKWTNPDLVLTIPLNHEAQMHRVSNGEHTGETAYYSNQKHKPTKPDRKGINYDWVNNRHKPTNRIPSKIIELLANSASRSMKYSYLYQHIKSLLIEEQPDLFDTPDKCEEDFKGYLRELVYQNIIVRD